MARHGTAQQLSALPIGWKRKTREAMLLPQSLELCFAAALPVGLSLRRRRHHPPPPMTAFTSLAALQQSLRLLSPRRGLHCGALFSHAPSPLPLRPLPSPKRPSLVAVESSKQEEEEGDEREAEWEDGRFLGLEARGEEKRRGRQTDEAGSGIPERDDGRFLGSEARGEEKRRGRRTDEAGSGIPEWDDGRFLGSEARGEEKTEEEGTTDEAWKSRRGRVEPKKNFHGPCQARPGSGCGPAGLHRAVPGMAQCPCLTKIIIYNIII